MMAAQYHGVAVAQVQRHVELQARHVRAGGAQGLGGGGGGHTVLEVLCYKQVMIAGAERKRREKRSGALPHRQLAGATDRRKCPLPRGGRGQGVGRTGTSGGILGGGGVTATAATGYFPAHQKRVACEF